MATRAPAVPLIPATRQRLWGPPAVANFALGGLGSGFYVAAVLAARRDPGPAATLASWLGPALVLVGFAAVAGEAGRPLRGPRVLTRLVSSWMSRELLLGGVFVVLAGADLLAPATPLRALALLAALAFAAAQGFIVRRARAIPAWHVGVMPLLFVVSALVSGGGLLVVVDALGESGSGSVPLGAVLVVLALGLVVWLAYLGSSGDPAFAASTRVLRRGPVAAGVVGGYVLASALAAVALARPDVATIAALLAGLVMVAGQMWTKWLLILTVGELRPVTLAGLTLRRRSS